MASLGRLTIDMVANLGGFERDMGRADRVTRKAMGNVRRELRSAERDMAKAQASLKNLGMQFAALAGVSVGVIVRGFRDMAQQADRIGKLSAGTGASVEAIQRLGFAAEQSGSSMEVLVKGLTTMQRNLQGASDDLTTYQRALERININHEDLLNLDPEQQFLRIADALNKTENATVRSATAQEIFGRAGRELLAMFDSGVGTIQEWSEALERTGAIMSGEMISDFENFNDQMNLLGRQFTGLKVQIFGDLIGPMADFVEFLNSETGTESLKQALEDIGKAAQVVGTLLGVRMVSQLIVYTGQLTAATLAVAKHSLALATMGTTAGTTMAAMRTLGVAVRTMLGPIGLLTTAAVLIAPAFFKVKDSFDDSKNSAEDLADKIARLTGNMQDLRRVELTSAFAEMTAEAEKTRAKIAEVEATIRQLESEADDVFGVDPIIIEYRAMLEELKQQYMGQRDALISINDALAKLDEAAQNAGGSLGDMTDEMADQKLKRFLRDTQDISDELEGPAMQAARAFAREIEGWQELLDAKIISPEQFANAARGLAQLAARRIKDGEVEESFADVAARGISEGIERAINSMSAGDISTMGFSQIGGVIGQSIFQSLGGTLGEEFLSGTLESFGESIGESIGDAFGKTAGKTMGETFGKAFGKIAGPIGEMLGKFIFDRIFPQKDPKFQVGGAIGFGATGAGRVSMDLSGLTPFGDLFIRFRKITVEAQDQLRDALVAFDRTIAGIVTDEGQMQRITTALAQWGFDTQEEGLTLERVLRSRFNAIVGTFDEFAQNMIRTGADLEQQIQNMLDLIVIRARMGLGDTLGPQIEDDTQIWLALDLARAGETMGQSFQRLLTITNAVNKALDMTGNTMQGGQVEIVRFGDALQRAFGDDLPRLTEGLSTIFETFFTEEENLQQRITSGKSLATQLLEQLGLDVTDAMLTETGFRDIFDQLFGALSPEDTAILIEAGVAIADLIDAEENLARARGEEVEASRSAADIANERAGLERRLATLMGDTDAIRQMELATVDESNRALLEHIYALEDQAEADRQAAQIANERTSLERRLAGLLGDTATIRQMELAAVDESNRELLERIHALEDEAEAERQAAQIANEREGLIRRELELLGNTEAIRQLELQALDESNREIQRRIYALEDEAAAALEASRVADERAGLESRLAQLLGDTDTLRRMELDSIDESNRALLERIYALEDQAEAERQAAQVANEREELIKRELQLLGDTEAIRQLELEALDQSNREIQLRIYTLEDEAEAVREAAQVASERAGLERRLLQLQGDTEALRQLEIDALDESNRELLRRIFALEDEEKAARQAEEAARQAQAEQDALRDAIQKTGDTFADAMIGVEEVIVTAPLNQFQREMLGIHRQLRQTTNAISAAAGSAITYEQASRALARAHEAAAIQAQAAIARLEASTRRLIQETLLDDINRQISELQQNSQSAANSIGNAANAMADLIAFADSLLVGNLSPLPSRERLTLGIEQLRAASQAGDVQGVRSLAQQVLQIGRERFASGPEFTELSNMVQDIIRSTVPAADVQEVTVIESPALTALFEQRDRINAEIASNDRRQTALDIAQAVADISQATGLSFSTVATNLGTDLQTLATALGVDVEELDSMLQTMAVDTFELANHLDGFVTQIHQGIMYMLEQLPQVISSAMNARELSVLSLISDLVDKIVVDPDKPPVKYKPPPDDNYLMGGKRIDDSKSQSSDSEVIRNTAAIARNTADLLSEIRRDQLRSSRTALA